MFDMQSRIDLVSSLKTAFIKADKNVPVFKDVETPMVNHKGTFGTTKLVDTNLIIAVTTTSDVVTFTDISTKAVNMIKVNEELRKLIISQMLSFKNCVRY